jgi:lipopolysaccharide/colanic/teichoic acid biosynthesis glycosyltransferase
MSIDEQAVTAEYVEALDEDVAGVCSSRKIASEYFARRATVMRIIGFVLFVVSVPLTALLIVIVRCTSRGPGIFRQSRVGKDGELFTMYKIRTMRQDAEAITGPVWAAEHDPRITRVGALLRFLHFDELPQLWNVARGDMALIGPRPERPEITEELIEVIPQYAQRVAVQTGITGLAQINLPADSDYASVARKLYLDLQYIDAASASIDIRIMLCTLMRMCGLRNGHAVSLLSLRRHVPISALDMIKPIERKVDSVSEVVVVTAGECEHDVSALRRRAK